MTSPFSLIAHRREVLISAGALALSGCASIIPKPVTPQLYVLRPQMPAVMGMPVRWRLSVAAPDTAASLDTARIALTRSATTMDYFANAAWNERIPLLFQRLLIQSFDASGRILSVDRDTSGLENDYVLETDIRDFQARYETPDGAPQIVVGVQAKLVRMPQRQIVASLNAQQQAQEIGRAHV